MNRKKRSITFLTLFLGICFIALGVVRKQHIDVISKAIKICLECVGIG